VEDVRWSADFRLRQWLGDYDERLVERVEQTLDEKMATRLQSAGAKLSQMSELLNVALQAPSASAVAAWVRYQVGRSATREVWSEAGLGKAVLADVTWLRGEARDLAGKVYARDQREEGEPELWIALMRRYAGWLRRRFVAMVVAATGGEADDEQG